MFVESKKRKSKSQSKQSKKKEASFIPKKAYQPTIPPWHFLRLTTSFSQQKLLQRDQKYLTSSYIFLVYVNLCSNSVTQAYTIIQEIREVLGILPQKQENKLTLYLVEVLLSRNRPKDALYEIKKLFAPTDKRYHLQFRNTLGNMSGCYCDIPNLAALYHNIAIVHIAKGNLELAESGV